MAINLLMVAGKKSARAIPVIVIVMFFWGCATQNPANVPSTETKQILDIIISESAEDLIVSVVGNQSLNHTETKQLDPIGVLFAFPDTSLAVGDTYFQSPDNDIIRFVQADEIFENDRTVARIFIALQQDTPHNLNQSETELQIVFAKPIVAAKDADPLVISTEKVVPQKSESTSVAVATRLETVTTETFEDKIKVTIKADGTIKNYKSFTISKPPRIVFDLYDMKSPYVKERKIVVQSQWVKQIRYFGHPNKLRLVLDTHNEYLSKYSSTPTDIGLIIQIGELN